MNASLATRGRKLFEVLNHIRNVNFRAIDARLVQCLVENFPRRSNEGMASQIFLISRLFSHKNNPGPRGTFSENCLGGIFPEIAGVTIAGRRASVVPVSAAHWSDLDCCKWA